MSAGALTSDDPEQVTLAAAYEHFLATGGIPEQARADLIKGIRAGEIPHRVGAATEYRGGRQVSVPPGEAPREESVPPRSHPLTQIPFAVLQSGTVKFDPSRSSAWWRDPETRSIIVVEEITLARDAILQVRPAPLAQPLAAVHPGGAPRAYDHKQILIEAFAHIYTTGLPSSLTDLCKAVETALPPGAVPGDTQFKAILRPLYQRMKQEQERE